MKLPFVNRLIIKIFAIFMVDFGYVLGLTQIWQPDFNAELPGQEKSGDHDLP
jgi:hypothetical protein